MSLSSAAVELHKAHRLSSNYLLSIIPVSILYYEYALTFSNEVEHFWPNESRHGIGWVGSFFFLNRYLALFGHIPIALGLFLRGSLADAEFCKGMRPYYGYLGMALQFVVAILCTIRVFALYNKNYYLLGALVTLIGVSVIIGIVAIATEAGDVVVRVAPHHMYGCNFSLALSDEGGQFLSVAWGGVMAFDFTVFALTLYKAIRVGRNVPLIHRILRDGSVYFFVLFTVNLANILTLLHAPTHLKNSATPFANVLSTTLLSRMMLRLRSKRILHPSHGLVWTSDVDLDSELSELSTISRYSAEGAIELKRIAVWSKRGVAIG